MQNTYFTMHISLLWLISSGNMAVFSFIFCWFVLWSIIPHTDPTYYICNITREAPTSSKKLRLWYGFQAIANYHANYTVQLTNNNVVYKTKDYSSKYFLGDHYFSNIEVSIKSGAADSNPRTCNIHQDRNKFWHYGFGIAFVISEGFLKLFHSCLRSARQQYLSVLTVSRV